jgi:hypothetical protein
VEVMKEIIVQETFSGEIAKGTRKEVANWIKRMKDAFKGDKLNFKTLSEKQYNKIMEGLK